jgi:ribosomal-protein-alanine N-acetyltransferase
MTTDDVTAVLELERRLFPEPWQRESFVEVLASERAYSLVFETDGVISAYIIMWKIIDETHLANLAVDVPFRRRGLARRLFYAGKEFFAGEGVRDFTLEVRVGNTAAIGLYESLGFVTAGVRPRYYSDGEDAYIMWLRL